MHGNVSWPPDVQTRSLEHDDHPMSLGQRDCRQIRLRNVEVIARIVRDTRDKSVEQGFRTLRIVGEKRTDFEAGASSTDDAITSEPAVTQKADRRTLRLINQDLRKLERSA